MFTRILFATDLTASSDEIVRDLSGLDSLGVQEIILAHVLELTYPGGTGAPAPYEVLLTDDHRRRAKKLLEAQKVRLEEQNFRSAIRILTGTPSVELSNLAREEGAGLLVVGSRGSSLAKDLFLGSTAFNILHEAPVPVLLKNIQVREKSGKRHLRVTAGNLTRHILYATDFSTTATHGFTALNKMASSGLVAKVTILHVESPDEDSGEARALLDGLKQQLDRSGVGKVTTRIVKGEPAAEIVKAATQPDISLVLMGTQGKGLMQEFFLGSVSQQVARKVRIPLLLLSPKARIQQLSATKSRLAG